jgi:hypothetical protein
LLLFGHLRQHPRRGHGHGSCSLLLILCPQSEHAVSYASSGFTVP